METKTQRLVKFLGSGWAFGLTVALFIFETGYVALTSRLPMAYDEAYHFNLIQFFAHRLSPIITGQAPDMYRFGALIQNTSVLYHYLLSFPYRIIAFFTDNPAIQVIGLRFINVALAVTGLVIMRKLARLVGMSDALANLVVLAVAMTPLFTVLSAQINYDNLLILAVAACTYSALLFFRRLDEGFFDAKGFLALLGLCLFSSLVKFTFLPVFAAIIGLAAWKIAKARRSGALSLAAGARKSFMNIGRYVRILLLGVCVLGGVWFTRIYGVNLARYHNPVPRCDQVLNTRDCGHYYAWSRADALQKYNRTHPLASHSLLRYDVYWTAIGFLETFSATLPFQGLIYDFPVYLTIVALLGTVALICTAISFNKIMQNRDLLGVAAICAAYILCLWAKNYSDYLQDGRPVAIHGRYLLPVLVYLYMIMALGLHRWLEDRRGPASAIKAGLALIIVVSFVYYGGFRQYVHYVDPVYGRISRSNDFTLDDVSPGN